MQRSNYRSNIHYQHQHQVNNDGNIRMKNNNGSHGILMPTPSGNTNSGSGSNMMTPSMHTHTHTHTHGHGTTGAHNTSGGAPMGVISITSPHAPVPLSPTSLSVTSMPSMSARLSSNNRMKSKGSNSNRVGSGSAAIHGVIKQRSDSIGSGSGSSGSSGHALHASSLMPSLHNRSSSLTASGAMGNISSSPPATMVSSLTSQLSSVAMDRRRSDSITSVSPYIGHNPNQVSQQSQQSHSRRIAMSSTPSLSSLSSISSVTLSPPPLSFGSICGGGGTAAAAAAAGNVNTAIHVNENNIMTMSMMNDNTRSGSSGSGSGSNNNAMNAKYGRRSRHHYHQHTNIQSLGTHTKMLIDNENAQGIMQVISVVRGSAAEEGGLKCGDIISQFGPIKRHNWSSLEVIIPMIRNHPHETIDVVVLRAITSPSGSGNNSPSNSSNTNSSGGITSGSSVSVSTVVATPPKSSNIRRLYEKLSLTLTPARWSEGGVLGCVLNSWPPPSPITENATMGHIVANSGIDTIASSSHVNNIAATRQRSISTVSTVCASLPSLSTSTSSSSSSSLLSSSPSASPLSSSRSLSLMTLSNNNSNSNSNGGNDVGSKHNDNTSDDHNHNDTHDDNDDDNNGMMTLGWQPMNRSRSLGISS